MAESELQPNPAHSRRTEGPTPAGGAYAIGYFFDADRKPCTLAEARIIEIHEFDADDQCIERTYATVPARN